MGADNAVHIQDTDAAAKDPWQIASIIAAYAKDQGFDIIFTGMQSQDRGSAQVGVLSPNCSATAAATTIVGFDYDRRHHNRQTGTGRGDQRGRQAATPGSGHLPARVSTYPVIRLSPIS